MMNLSFREIAGKDEILYFVRKSVKMIKDVYPKKMS